MLRAKLSTYTYALVGLLLIFCSFYLALGQQGTIQRLADTSSGLLQVAGPKADQGISIELDGHEVAKVFGTGVSVAYSNSKSSPDVLVLEVGTGGNICSASYRILVLKEHPIGLTRDLGNCSDMPQISMQGRRILLRFPATRDMGSEIWHYTPATAGIHGQLLKYPKALTRNRRLGVELPSRRKLLHLIHTDSYDSE